MNDEARALLVAAALRKHTQVRYMWHHPIEGECALGVLHLEMHATRTEAVACLGPGAHVTADTIACWRKLHTRFGISDIPALPRCEEHPFAVVTLQHLNDEHRADFLTIARMAP